MKLRCTLDDLLLHAEIQPNQGGLWAFDGPEGFLMEALEVVFYEVVSATWEEIARLEEAGYRLLRYAEDFEILPS